MAVINTPVTREQLMKKLELKSWDRLEIGLNDQASHFTLHMKAEDLENEGMRWPSNAATYGFMERFPQRTEKGMKTGNQWEVPATDISAQLITELWPASQVRASPDATIVLQYLLTTVQHQQLAMHRTAKYREYLSLKPMILGLGAPTEPFVNRNHGGHDGLTLMLHQDVGLENSLHSDGYGLFMEQGTGKTPIVVKRVDIEAPIKMLKDKKMYRCIIVAPKNVRQNWAIEFDRFSEVRGKVTVLRGGEFKRAKAIFEAMVKGGDDSLQYTVVVCSYECLSGKTWDIISKFEWDLAVLDEGHYIKGASKRAKAAMELRDVSLARLVLTGTPICNSVFDLFNLFEFMREGGSGFTSREAFCQYYGVFEARDPSRGTKRLAGVQNMPFMKERLARSAFIVKKSEALPDLPEKVYDICEVEMTDKQQKFYDELAEKLMIEIDDEMENSTNKTLTAESILVKLLRLAQITSGFVSYDPIMDEATGEVLSARQIEHFDPNPKLDAMMELFENKGPWQKTIIWAHFRQDHDAIQKRLLAAGLDCVVFRGGTKEHDRDEYVRRFNCDPLCKVFIGNPGAGGTGLNLLGYDYTSDKPQDTNCDHVIYYSQDWSHPKRSQSEDRNHRKGTRCNVRITDLTVLNTVDEEIRARVTNKRTSALQVQDLREILKRVLGR